MIPRRAVPLAACTAAILLLATGCDGPSGPTQTPSPSVTLPPAPTPSPSATVSPAPTPSPSESSAATIDIQSPVDGSTVAVPVRMRGTANTFEAALTVDALNEAGDILCVRHIMATSGSGTPGTWETRLGFAPESDTEIAPVTLRAYELSAKDGSITNLVERKVSLSPNRPPIMVTSPVCGDAVAPGGSLAIQGLATVFEAALTVELRDASGAAVFSKILMTEEGNVESRFSDVATIPAGLVPGFYDLVAFNFSAKDGSIENEFPVQLRVE
jgi:Predicted solute binding protein